MNANEYFNTLTPSNLNSAQRPSITWNRPLPDEPNEWILLQNRAALDTLNVERAATLLLGELMLLELDKQIFRGSMPPNATDGFTVAVTAEEDGESPRLRNYSLQCVGIQSERDALLAPASRLLARLPLPAWTEVAGKYIPAPILFTAIGQVQKSDYSTVKEAGKTRYRGNIYLYVKVLIG